MTWAIFAGTALDRLLDLPAGDDVAGQLAPGETAAPWAAPAPPPLTAGVEALWSGLTPGCPVLVIDPASGETVADGAADADGEAALRIDVAGPWTLALGWVRRWAVEVAP